MRKKKEEAHLWSSSSSYGGSSSSRHRFLRGGTGRVERKCCTLLSVTSSWGLNYHEPSTWERVSVWIYVFVHTYKIELIKH